MLRLSSLALIMTLPAIIAAPASAPPSSGPRPTLAAPASPGPLGWQTYRRLDLLPLTRQGVNTFQASSYDPTGNNDDGFSGRYSCLHRVAEGCLMAEHNGPGELESVWTAGNQQGDPAAAGGLMIVLDGRMVVDRTWPQLTDGSTRSPFAFPLALAASESWGGPSLQVPLPFHSSMRVISQFNPHYFHVVYRTFASAPSIKATSSRNLNPGDVLTELRHAGTRDPKPRTGPVRALASTFHLNPGQHAVVGRISGPGAITELRLRMLRYHSSSDLPSAARNAYEGMRLRISFDGQRTVDAPLGEAFGSGLGPAKVRALMFAMDGNPYGWARTWWPMPFAAKAQVELINSSSTGVAGQLGLTWAPDNAWAKRLGPGGQFGYFHAFGHSGQTRPGRYWTFLQTRGTGTFMGVTLTMRGPDPSLYLEGNERGYVDEARQPQLQGTGTEDFFDGGWYFWDFLFTLPLSGYTNHATSSVGACLTPTCKTAYRLMIADAVPFSHSILYEIQHGPQNNVSAIYSSTAYWYQRRVSGSQA